MSAHLIERSRTVYLALGSLALAAIVGLVAVAIAANRGVFTSNITVTLIADRSGLMLEPGSDVKMRDVVVGRVRSIELVDGDAVVTMGIDSDMVSSIPTNATARIDLTTLFGRKFVALGQPADPADAHIDSGFVFHADSVPTEVNDLLDVLVRVLRTVEPRKVDATLGAISTALEGRGDGLGNTLVALDTYLATFNGSLPTLQRDLSAAAESTDILASATPDLMHTIESLTTTGSTINEKEAGLTSFLLSFTEFGNSGRSFMTDAGVPLQSAVASLAPTTGLLAERASSLPCFISDLAQTNRYLERTVGGSNMAGLNILGTLLMGDPPYTSPEDLPIVGADGPSQCYDWSKPLGHTDFNDGSHAYGPVVTPLDLLGNPFAQFFPGAGR